MTDEKHVSGSCLCGGVTFQVELPSLFCGHCHCTMCQRNHGAAFVTWFGIPRGKLTIEKGPDDLVVYRSSEHGTRSFCRHCGSSLFCESSHHPDRVDIPLANMHDPIDRPPQLHAHFDDQAAWLDLEDDLPRLGGSSGMDLIKPKD